MKTLFAKIVVLVAALGIQGCGPFSTPPDLKVTTLYIAPWVVPQLTILNEDERPVVVESVTVNGKYDVRHVWGPSKLTEFSKTPLETGQSITLRLESEWPRAIRVKVRTNRGTVESKFEYSQ